MSKALLIVDPQVDFMPGGSLAVHNGDKIIEPLNKVIDSFGGCDIGDIIMSMDWHPEVTSHFEKYGGRWPIHCVKNTVGAYPPDSLNVHELFGFNFPVFYKGFKQNEDCYSAFDGFNSELYILDEYLKMIRIQELYIGGLATDYCVRATVLDALKLGYKVNVIADCCAAVNEVTGIQAVAQMTDAGARFINSDGVIKEVKAQWE